MEIEFPRPQGSRPKPKGFKKEPTPAIRSGFFKTFDGTKLFYSIEGKGRPLIFCYGLVCSSLHWTYQIDHFRKSYQSVWFDYRGHFNSDRPKDLKSMTMSNIAHDLGYLIDELDIKDAVFIGHSMGVNIVLDFYRQRPEKVAGMILSNGTACRPLDTMFRSNAAASTLEILKVAHNYTPSLLKKIWTAQRESALAKLFIRAGGFNPHLTPKEDIDLYVKQVFDMDTELFINLIQSYHDYDATPWLHTVNTPTLILGGEIDQIVPFEQQQLLHQLIPDSELVKIPHGSHCSQMDLPEMVNEKIQGFLDRISWV